MYVLNVPRPNTATLDFLFPAVFKQAVGDYRIFKLLLHSYRGNKKAKQSHYRLVQTLRVPGG